MGFFAKQFVLYSAIQSGYYFMSVIAILMSVISASYYLKIVRTLYTENSNIDLGSTGPRKGVVESNLIKTEKINTSAYAGSAGYDITTVHSFLISTLSLFILLFILKPSILLNSSQLLSLSLFQC